jgi:hypothetical protein
MPGIVLTAGYMEITLVGAAAAIVGGLLSGAYQHWREHFSRPKLEWSAGYTFNGQARDN